MSFRTIVISSRAKLETRMNYLIVRGENDSKIHLSEINTIIVDSTAVAITAGLLCELSNRKIKLIFCDEKHNPHCEMVPYYGSHDTSEKIKNQTNWSLMVKSLVWTNVIRLKIKKQSEHLRSLGLVEHETLEKYQNEIVLNDLTNREGHSAKLYFISIFGKDFTRSNSSSINMMLNYGYAIILSAFNREIVSSGYITQIGLKHCNEYNHFNLASDLMEPFRIVIDRAVVDMIDEPFEKEQRNKLVDQLNKEVIIFGKKQFLSNAIKIYCKSVFNALNEENELLIKEYYEL